MLTKAQQYALAEQLILASLYLTRGGVWPLVMEGAAVVRRLETYPVGADSKREIRRFLAWLLTEPFPRRVANRRAHLTWRLARSLGCDPNALDVTCDHVERVAA